MARLCERPGCKREATVVFGFQAEQRLVWIDAASPDQSTRTRSGALCKEHADRMTAPVGWHLDDRRQPVPQLFRTPSGNDDSTGALERKARRRKVPPAAETKTVAPRDEDQTLSLFALDDLEPAKAPTTDTADMSQPDAGPEPDAAAQTHVEPEPEPEPEPPVISPFAVADPTSENSTIAMERYVDELPDDDHYLLDLEGEWE